MANLYMYDDVNLQLIPSDAKVIAAYLDGRYGEIDAARTRFPHAIVLGIAVFASDDAMVLDVEQGDATIADVYGWLKRQLAAGRYRPIIYISVSRVDRLMETMNANGFKRSEYRIWSAHYGDGPHICGPDTCKLTREPCDWTQFTNRADNSSLDESLLPDEPIFHAPAPKPAPAPAPKPPVAPPAPVPPAPVAAPAPLVTEAQAEAALKELAEFVAEHK